MRMDKRKGCGAAACFQIASFGSLWNLKHVSSPLCALVSLSVNGNDGANTLLVIASMMLPSKQPRSLSSRQ